MDIINLIVESNTLNFIIVLSVLIFIFVKLNVGKKLDNVRTEIKGYVNAAENEKQQAEEALNEIKNKISHLPEEVSKIERSAKNSVASLERSMDKTIKEQMIDIDNNSNRIMNLETKKFKSKLTSKLSELSVNLAKDNAIKQLNNNRELHDKYIYEAIAQIDGANL